MESKYLEKYKEIVRFAERNNGIISHHTVIDILKNDDNMLDAVQLTEIIELLKADGVDILPEKDEGYGSDETETANFIPADVNISQKGINVYNLMERLDNNEINLNPGFQRHGGLWNLEKQSRLIESLMLKIPIPAFYFNAEEEDNWIVIDGLQRLTAFQNYLVGIKNENGKVIKEKFVGLQYLRDFNGYTFDDLPRQYVRRIKETGVVAYSVEKGTPDGVVFNIFQRINTGGVELNPQEIRQALYQGKSTELIQELAESEEFIAATQNAIKPDRMEDREYVTRFLAFTELNYEVEYADNIDEFLIKILKLVNTYDDSRIESIKNNFKDVMVFCRELFGVYAFRKYNKDKKRSRINKAIFEIWSICFRNLSQEEKKRILNRKDEFFTRFGELLQDPKYLGALRSGKKTDIIRRVDMTREMLKEFL